LAELDARLEFEFEEVAFIEEEDEVDGLEEFVGDDGAPEDERIFESVHAGIFCENLIKCGYWSEEDDRVD
jgi:hypothetical protein